MPPENDRRDEFGPLIQAMAESLQQVDKTARLYANGYEVRVDLGNTGHNWPDCPNPQPGFPFLSFGKNTWEAAEKWARDNGATNIIRVPNNTH